MKLSVITICYNETRLIEKTIRSVLNQTFKDYQYIVIDGASTDGTIEIINKFDNKIDIFISESDKGIYNAMNKGLHYVNGEYVLFLNGGDYLANDRVFENVFASNCKEDILHGYMQNIEGDIIKSLPKINIKKYLKSNTLPHQATFVKKRIFDEIGGFDESFQIAGDYDFFVRAIYEYDANTKYLPVLVSFFNLNGVARMNPQRREHEKLTVQRKVKKLNSVYNLLLRKALKLFPKFLSEQTKEG
ncbi:MAG: glycosyltransferase [Candidatus Electrothrix sp. MAN1_4]|nr:glycosyltransferase [Candidatus Electrothrix sp. MAN1_4]